MFLDVKATYGAVGNGTTDDRAAFHNADIASPPGTIYVPAGTYRIGSNLTIASDIRFQQGAVLKPDGGVTIHLDGRVDAGLFQIFDVSATGSSASPRRETQFVPQWWGATGNGTTDDYPAIAAMLDAAREYAGGARKATSTEIEPDALATPVLFFPNGIYRVTTPLDCTAGDPAPAKPNFYTLRGCGMRRSVILGDTGESNAIIELVGSNYSVVEGLTLEVSRDAETGDRLSTASGTGILLARTKDENGDPSQSWFVNIRDVEIVMGSSASANDTQGTIGIYNFCCEVSDIHNVYSQADYPLVFAAINTMHLESVHRPSTDTYGLIDQEAGSSMTACTVTGNNMLVGGRGPAVLLAGGGNIYIQAHATRQAAPDGDPCPWAIEVVNQVQDLEYRGSVEVFEGVLRTIARIRGLRLHAYAPYSLEYPRVFLDKDPATVSPQLAYIEDSIIDVVPNPLSYNTTPPDVEGYVIDSVSTWANAVFGSLVFLRRGKVRLPNSFTPPYGSFLRSNLLLSDNDLSSGEVSVADRSGNVLIAKNGMESDGPKLGLGTTATGTTLGSVVRKVEVFDGSGTSLGFVAIYNSIT